MQWIWLKLPVFKSKAVTVISEATKYDVIKYTGCNPSKVYVIPDPVGENFTYHPKAFNADRPRILQIGTWPNKNLPRVIEALKDIKAELVIIGEFKEGQEAMLRESGINYKNYYNLTEEELLLQYQNSDILIFATTFEGFGLPIIEAQGIGRIVITSNISPMKEVAGDAAILVDPYNTQAIREAILKAINDDQYREELIQKGLENVKQYNPSVIAHQYLSLYSEIIKNHR